MKPSKEVLNYLHSTVNRESPNPIWVDTKEDGTNPTYCKCESDGRVSEISESEVMEVVKNNGNS